MRKFMLFAAFLVVATQIKNEKTATIIDCVEHEAMCMIVH